MAIKLKVQLNLVFMFSCFFRQQKFIAGPPIFVVIFLCEKIKKQRFFHICSQPNQIKMHKKETFGSVIYLAYNPILIFSLSENCCLRVIIIKDSWAFLQIKTRLGGILFLVKNKISLFFSSFKTFLVVTIVFTKAIQCDGQIQQSSI